MYHITKKNLSLNQFVKNKNHYVHSNVKLYFFKYKSHINNFLKIFNFLIFLTTTILIFALKFF